MLFKKKNTLITDLDKELEQIYSDMSTMDRGTESYQRMVDQYSKLMDVKEKHERRRISPEVLVATAGQIAMILLVLHYEKADVITSKAMSFVKGRA